jgi:hypothetical protein
MKSCFFETDSCFRVPRDGNGQGVGGGEGAALLGGGSSNLAMFSAIRRALVGSVLAGNCLGSLDVRLGSIADFDVS